MGRRGLTAASIGTAASAFEYFVAEGSISKGDLLTMGSTTVDGTAVKTREASKNQLVVGIAAAAYSAGDVVKAYTWGYCPYVRTDGTVAAAANLSGYSTVAGEAGDAAAGASVVAQVIGIALTADSSDDYVTAWLQIA